MYSGNLGLAHSFDEFLEAARRLASTTDIVFLFVGDGPRKGEVQAARDSEGLTNIRLLEPVPRDWLHASLSLADVHLISMRPEMNGIVVPGKLYGAMAAGRPIVFVGPEHCEPADTIRNAGCGFTLAQPAMHPPSSRRSRFWPLTRASARRMGERARTSFIAHYEQRLCCSRWCELIEETLATSPASQQSCHGLDTGAVDPSQPSRRPPGIVALTAMLLHTPHPSIARVANDRQTNRLEGPQP